MSPNLTDFEHVFRNIRHPGCLSNQQFAESLLNDLNPVYSVGIRRIFVLSRKKPGFSAKGKVWNNVKSSLLHYHLEMASSAGK
jgi:hypothetical protein